MNRLTLLVAAAIGATIAASGQQSAAIMSPVRPMPAPAGATRFGNILFPGGVPTSHPRMLGGTVSGMIPYTGVAPGQQGRRGRTTVVPYAVPLFVGGFSGYGYGPEYAYPVQQQPVTVVVPQQPAPQIIINHNYGADGAPQVSVETQTERGQLQVYEAKPRQAPARQQEEPRSYVRDGKPNIYLIVLTDETVRQAIGYWVEGNMLNYVTPEASIGKVELEKIDRAASSAVNSQRNLEFELALPIQ